MSLLFRQVMTITSSNYYLELFSSWWPWHPQSHIDWQLKGLLSKKFPECMPQFSHFTGGEGEKANRQSFIRKQTNKPTQQNWCKLNMVDFAMKCLFFFASTQVDVNALLRLWNITCTFVYIAVRPGRYIYIYVRVITAVNENLS